MRSALSKSSPVVHLPRRTKPDSGANTVRLGTNRSSTISYARLADNPTHHIAHAYGSRPSHANFNPTCTTVRWPCRCRRADARVPDLLREDDTTASFVCLFRADSCTVASTKNLHDYSF